MHAELAYLFRHALLRDAAYDLQPPEERGRLHALAHDVIAALFAGPELDALAIELARHAGVAGLAREGEWLERAARHSALGWRGAEAADLYTRLARHAASDAATRVRAWTGAGKSLLDIGRLQRAIEALEAGVALAADDASRLDGLRPLSYAYRNVGRHEDALRVALQIEAATRNGAPEMHALAMDSVATALTGLERHVEARPYAEKAVQKAALGDNVRIRGGMKANLGVLLGRVGERERGVEFLRDALIDLQASGDRRAIAAARRNLADHLRVMGQVDAARDECNAALREMRELGDTRGHGMALLTAGGIAKDTGQPREALRLLLQSAELLAESGDKRSASFALVNAAEAALDAREFAECERLAARTRDLAAQSGSGRASAMAQAIEAALHREQGRLRESAAAYQAAIDAYTALALGAQAAWVRGLRAVVLRRAGDPQAVAEYEAALRAAAPDDVAVIQAKWQAAAI